MYDPQPYPTLYNGRRYRSRLEARWAAFFDRLGWPFEDEPYDLGGWSPDFLLRGHDLPILVEVKPIDRLDAAVCGKMTAEVIAKGEAAGLGDRALKAIGGVSEKPSMKTGWIWELPERAS